MSFFGHWQFFFVLIPVLAIAMILGIREHSLKNYRLVVSVGFILCILGQSPENLTYFLLFFLLEWALLLLFLHLTKRLGRRDGYYFVTLFVSILPLILSKLSSFTHLSLFCFVGISYITFKVVQMIIEIYDGVITELSFYEYSCFLLFFPTISSGPIDRSRRFLTDQNTVLKREQYTDLAMKGITRLLVGYIYKTIIAGKLYFLLTCCLDMLGKGAPVYYEAAYAYIYGLYLFFDFAGYSLMAIGASYVLGIYTPDNFRQPFISTDIKDFWDRWHISLSHWFRDFIFTRLVMRCKKKKWFHSRLTRANVCFIVNMAVMGMWHGLSPSYILYGLYHGILLAITETYQKKSKFYKTYHEKKWYRQLSWFITMQLYMFGFYIFSGRLLTVLTSKFIIIQ